MCADNVQRAAALLQHTSGSDPNMTKYCYSDLTRHSFSSIQFKLQHTVAQKQWRPSSRHSATPTVISCVFPPFGPLRRFVALSDDCAATVFFDFTTNTNTATSGARVTSALLLRRDGRNWPCTRIRCAAHPRTLWLSSARTHTYHVSACVSVSPSRHKLRFKHF